MLRLLSLSLRLLGNIFLYLGVLLKQVYDLPLFVPLWLEERMAKKAREVGLAGRAVQ
jgi:F0F1-type ATP synthase membrane subunit a